MAGRVFISPFSPNRTNPEVREAIFVQRHKLAEVWLERLVDSVLTGTKHHLLAVGPRGCGKSHLVALLVHRLRQNAAVRERVRIAWLPEDETTPSFWKFLLRILRALHAEYRDEFPPPPRGGLVGAADDRRAAALTDYLLNKLGGRTLLVVVENLDEVMKGLKSEGQKRWRAFLQNHAVAATLATSQQLTKDVSSRERPFFGFFQIEYLKPLSADEALSLLLKIAQHNSNTALVGFLQTPTGRARVRAVRHIAGGSHRVFIILSEFATRENLDDLVGAFEELLDELTPYYQERLRWLPDQQREIVEYLCRQARTMQVKQIAGELFLTEQTAAAQLKQLKDKGYVTAESVGRESRYELTEPLMRLCVEVKERQREPIRLIIEFLRIWYDPAGVEARLHCLPADAELERGYFQAAFQLDKSGVPNPVNLALDQDLETARAIGDSEEMVRVLVELAATADHLFVCGRVAGELDYLGRYAEALIACDRAIELDPKGGTAWSHKGYMLNKLGRHDEALTACDRAIKHNPEDAVAWHNRGCANFGLGQFGEAVDDFHHEIELNGNHVAAFEGMAEAYVLLDNWTKAERALLERFQLQLPTRRSYLVEFNHLPDLIAAIFRTSANLGAWAHRVGRLADIAREAQADSEKKPREQSMPSPPNPHALLGDALVRSLTNKAYAEAPADALDAWAEVWREVAEREPDLSLAARLFSVGVRYVQTKDERVLLDLVQEERAILRDLFRLDEDTDQD